MMSNGIITACVFGLGAVARAALGYATKVKESPKIEWDWIVFIKTTLPAFGAGFLAGIVLPGTYEVFSTEWFVFIISSFAGGVGIGSLQSNLGKVIKS